MEYARLITISSSVGDLHNHGYFMITYCDDIVIHLPAKGLGARRCPFTHNVVSAEFVFKNIFRPS
jgi:hypothetical protein